MKKVELMLIVIVGIVIAAVVYGSRGDYIDDQPSLWVASDSIHGVYNWDTQKYQISIPNSPNNIVIMGVVPTHSMLPVLSDTSTVLMLKLEDKSQINVGDIIVFEYGDTAISHRVVEKGSDDKGLFFVTKGDHNRDNDIDFCGKVRPEQVVGVVVGIIY